ncbi:MAG: hypothetical protein QMC02_09330 [Halioglobus sp.]
MAEQHHMRQFLLFVFTLLIPFFALWTIASAAIALPAIGIVGMLLTNWFPDVVNALYASGSEAILMTEFGENAGQLIPLSEAEYRLGFEVNTQILSYSFPFYTALHFATQKKNYLTDYLWGVLMLYVLFVFGLVCLCLKELMVNVGAPFFNQPGAFVPYAEVIAIAYQFSVLIVPTLAPAVLWIWQSKDSQLLQGVFVKTVDS